MAGRWTKAEHLKFLEALKLYGKNWKLVQEHVGTRSATQARSHAQKYFAKLEKQKVIYADNRNQEATSVESPQFRRTDSKHSKGKTLSIKLPRTLTDCKRKLCYSENLNLEPIKKTEITSVNQKYMNAETTKEGTCGQIAIDEQQKGLNEQSFPLELESISQMNYFSYEPFITTSRELEITDYLPFSNESAQVDSNNEEAEYPDIPLVRKYPTLTSLFE